MTLTLCKSKNQFKNNFVINQFKMMFSKKYSLWTSFLTQCSECYLCICSVGVLWPSHRLTMGIHRQSVNPTVLHTAQCTLHTTHCTLHTTHCTLHYKPLTLHTVHCILHVINKIYTYYTMQVAIFTSLSTH